MISRPSNKLRKALPVAAWTMRINNIYLTNKRRIVTPLQELTSSYQLKKSFTLHWSKDLLNSKHEKGALVQAAHIYVGMETTFHLIQSGQTFPC